jgi:hypothetical protein
VGRRFQQVGLKAAVEVSIHIAPTDRNGRRIAFHQFEGEALVAERVGGLAPKPQQMHPIAFIAVGAANHQHPGPGGGLSCHRQTPTERPSLTQS